MQHIVLVIDDNQDVRELMKFVIEREKAIVITATDGIDGLDAIRNSVLPTLIIVDHNMDRMDGPSFLINLEKEFPEIMGRVPIVMMTANDVRDVKPNKATEVICKVGNLSVITGIIKKYCK